MTRDADGRDDTGVPEGARGAARVRIANIYEVAGPEDGYRVLATRYWPRGVPRSACDEYVPLLAPSQELLGAFRDQRIDWWAFRKRYLDEMQSPQAQAEIRRLAALSRTRTLTLICVCKDANRCHRSLLRDMVTERGKQA